MKNIIISLILIVIGLTIVGCKIEDNFSDNLKNNSQIINDTAKQILESSNSQKIDNTNVPIKTTVNLQVPFAVQFPTGSLDYPYQEGCEEASIIMAKAFIDGNTNDTVLNNEIDNTLISMVDWQNKNWGGHFDLDAFLTLELMQKYYNIPNGQVLTINSIDDIKSILSQDKLVIAPTYGMKLENPYFTAPGPAYHMLVIKGYNESQFITNDPGIGLGKDFTYSYQNLFDAIHDLPSEAKNIEHYIKNHHELMEKTQKSIIVMSK